jgi:peptidoglycan/xylan/chitin deacetylase (PgdA/CDA1 family)/SAM-dependent methyltransferase
MSQREYWNRVTAKESPWNSYEQTKYHHTLEALPDSSIVDAVELGCATGVFTEMLAGRVERVLAIDVAHKALDQAKVRCENLNNITFLQHDIGNGMIGSDWDLVVCLEMLYYIRDRHALKETAKNIVRSMKVGGHLLMTHSHMVSDDKSCTGFDFAEIGAKFIGETFAAIEELQYLRELRTELYTVQLFRRVIDDTAQEMWFRDRMNSNFWWESWRAKLAGGLCAERKRGRRVDHVSALPAPGKPGRVCPRELLLRKNAEVEHPSIKWGGCLVTTSEARHCWMTSTVPILMYHRVATEGPDELAPYRTSPELFERQLAWLQRLGYHSINLDTLYKCLFERGMHSFAGKPVAITFDDAYSDFYYRASPLLRRYGFSATVFVPTDYVGGWAEWDAVYGAPAQIMSWEQIIELSAEGTNFGSHGCCHKRLIDLSKSGFLSDVTNSRIMLETRLNRAICGYSFPYTASDVESRRVVKEAGYKYAVIGGYSSDLPKGPFCIPRIEIFGDDTIDKFIGKLPVPQLAEDAAISNFHELRSRRDRSTYISELC